MFTNVSECTIYTPYNPLYKRKYGYLANMADENDLDASRDKYYMLVGQEAWNQPANPIV
jgi:hypothetical protein